MFDESKTYYEFFYFPIQEDCDGYSKEHVLQNAAYDLAAKKGFANIEWIKELSDNHCKQLISCLMKHEHTTAPEEYCPYKQKCGFNPSYGWMELDRRAYYRAKVSFNGELYLKSLKDRPVPPQLTSKKILCQALDLSVEGIKLQLKNICLPEKCVVELVFDDFSAEGIVVWIKECGEDWLAGIKFSDLDDEQYSSIIKVVTMKRVMVK